MAEGTTLLTWQARKSLESSNLSLSAIRLASRATSAHRLLMVSALLGPQPFSYKESRMTLSEAVAESKGPSASIFIHNASINAVDEPLSLFQKPGRQFYAGH